MVIDRHKVVHKSVITNTKVVHKSVSKATKVVHKSVKSEKAIKTSLKQYKSNEIIDNIPLYALYCYLQE